MFLVSLQRNSQPLCQINEIIRKNESQKRAYELFHPYIFCYLLYGSYFDSEYIEFSFDEQTSKQSPDLFSR